jgi:alpha-mannosidase
MFFAVERINRIVSELGDYIYTSQTQVTDIKFKSCGYDAYELLYQSSEGWETCAPNQSWGGKDQHYWFKTVVTVPVGFEGKRVVLRVETGRRGWDALDPQLLVFVNGVVTQGLDVNHKEVLFAEHAKAGESYEIDLYDYTGMRDGYTQLNVSLCVLETEVEKLYYNLRVPLQVCKLLDDEDIRRVDILNYLTEAINMLDLRKPFSKAFYETVDKVNRYLDIEFYGKLCGKETVTEVCVGHTHIDVAWLWTLAQTREKTVRSFATVLNLMKQYPEYVFMSSQPQLYDYVRQDQPDLYEEIKKMVKTGRWEAEGAMWLEADCNITSGESLVRQILFGKRFFKEEFGVDNKILWLPDVFGYSAALPQILKKSGVDYFMTTKISSNEFNMLPYDTFMWKGLDGTEILTYFISTQEYVRGSSRRTTTYNGDATPAEVKGCWNRYQQKEINSEVLNSYGFGDGGGGPTREMLECLSRLEKGIPGCPKTKTGTALEFFRNLESRVSGNKRLPKWVGELYFESHRGTYTSIARNKKFNRKTEFLNQDAELLSSMNTVLCGAVYPREEINACWQTTLLNQFHDIIPGSSIREVYEDSKAQYEAINRKGRELVESALQGIVDNIRIETTSVAVFNQLGFTRSDAVTAELPQGWRFAKVFDGSEPVKAQQSGSGCILFFAKNVPPKGYKIFTLRQAEPEQAQSADEAKPSHLENRFFAIAIDSDGTLLSIYDKVNGREVLQPGHRGNQLQAFEDKPSDCDAWNIDIYYQEKMWEVNDVTGIETVEDGPVRSGVKVSRRFLDSTIDQTYYIYNDIPRIDFDTAIDWKEKQVLLKAAFPVDIRAEKATYEIQYGNVERPTHWNTSWDWARFEVCAHKWADLSEEGYGISLMNDCKYGYDIRDSVMRLTLLKSATSPNVDADREHHSFVYSLYPHQNSWKQGDVANMAYKLNCPMYAICTAVHPGVLPGEFYFVKTNSDNVMIDVVKQAEDSADVIVRLYEFKNKRSSVTLTFGKPFTTVWECNMMENEAQELASSPNQFSFIVRPYEIRTFKIRF